VKSLLSALLAFLGPVAGAVKGILTPEELRRAFATAAASSTVVGFVTTFLATIGKDAGSISAAGLAGIVAALVSFVALHLSELVRRLGHGSPPSAAPFIRPH
jgi:hypothetical protein